MLNTPFSQEQGPALEGLFYRRLLQKIQELHQALMALPHRTWSLGLAHELNQKTQGILGQINCFEAPLLLELGAQFTGRMQQLTSEASVLAPDTLERCIESIEHIETQIQQTTPTPLAAAIPEHLIVILSDQPDEAKQMVDQFIHFGFDSVHLHLLSDLKTAVTALQPSALVVNHPFQELIPKDPEDPPLSLPTWLGRSIPTIFIAEKGDLTTRLFAVRAGGSGFYCTPIEYDNLVETLDHLLTPSDQTPFRIMIVDDSKTQSSSLNATLHKAGMQTKVINDPLAITGALIEFSPELILLDLYMPGCSGEELASVIRQQQAYVSVPIVFLSAESDRVKQRNAMALGGDDFLTKPVDPLHLVSSVRTRTLRSRILRSQMIRDSLTGLLNHSRILEQLDIEISRALRHGTNLCFAMLDIDHFKQVNDTYGHPVGDRVIKSLARLLTQRLRKSDTIGRYGGEEFALILPQTDPKVVSNILNEIRESFGNTVQRYEDGEFFVKLSGGMSFLDLKTQTVDALCKAADEALYEAKRSGRNKIISQFDIISPPPEPEKR